MKIQEGYCLGFDSGLSMAYGLDKIKRFFRFIINSSIALFFVALVIVVFGLCLSPEKSDIAVVLGNEVTANGMPSERLRARLDSAINIYNHQMVRYIVVSGGVGESGYDEARVMADYLLSKNIESNKILLDSNGNNTAATAKNVAKLMEIRGFSGVVIVSQYFHLARCYLAFYENGIRHISAVYPMYFEKRDVLSIMREVIAIPVYAINR